MSARAWAFQQGILWAMDFGCAQEFAQSSVEDRQPADSGPLPSADSAEGIARSAVAQTSKSRLPARFDEVGPDALAHLARAMDVRAPATESRGPSAVARRFDAGRRCFAGRLDDEIVTYGWLSQGHESVGELERDYHLQPGEAYIWDCATLPAHRGSGLYGALLSHIIQTLRAEGIQRAWIGANLENEPSLRAFARAGFQPVVKVAYARLLRLRCLRLLAQPAAPAALVDRARGMLTEPYERAWRTLIVGVRPSDSAPEWKAAT